MSKKIGLLLTAVVALGFGCASKEKRFEDIVPGMDTEQVRDTMKEGPSRFENIADTNYTSWYWKDEYCVLFKDNKVVAKDSRTEDRNVNVGPGKYTEVHTAQCLAPGQVAESATERSVNIPGVGKVTLPKSFPFPRSPEQKEPQSNQRPRDPASQPSQPEE